MTLPKLDTSIMGTTGLREIGGRIDEEFLRELVGERGIAVYKEMSENDSIIGAVIFAIDMLIRNVDWDVQKVSDDPEDVEAADFVKSNMDDMSHSWKEMISEILSMLVYGWSWHEIVYKMRVAPDHADPTKRSKFTDGRIGWRKLPIRSQETWFRWWFDEKEVDSLVALEQWDMVKGIKAIIPIEKSLLFRTRHRKNNPEGRSILRTAYRSWYFKKHIENIEGIGIERDLAGLPVMWVPPELLSANASSDDRALATQLRRIITSIKRDEQEGILMPQSFDENSNRVYDLTLLSTGGTRQFDTTKIVGRYNQAIAMSVLADFILLGHEKVGSFALASSKTEMFASAMGAFMDGIADVFNRFAIPRLFALNTFKVKDFPKITHGDIETVDLAELGSYVTSLAGAGMSLFPDEDLENHLRSQANFPMSNTDKA